jgi:hypothetical protein
VITEKNGRKLKIVETVKAPFSISLEKRAS